MNTTRNKKGIRGDTNTQSPYQYQTYGSFRYLYVLKAFGLGGAFPGMLYVENIAKKLLVTT